MENLARKLKKYNYEDIENIRNKTNERYEIINGDLYLMSSPRGIHQLLLGEIFGQLREFFKDKPCKPFVAPFDVIFSKSKDRKNWDTVVQPDIFVLCDLNKYEKNYVKGAPNFIIEIASPSNLVHDRFRKYTLYQKYGVKEYWIIEPNDKKIFTFVYDEKKEMYGIFGEYDITEEVPVASFKNLKISLADFYKKNQDWIVKEDEKDYDSEE